MNFKLIKRTFCNTLSNNKSVYSFAIVGSGPGGFYTAKHLLRKYRNIQIDIYEKLPHPYGLVRTGVAPDHQEVKNVEKDFQQVLEDRRVRFLGNVEIGKDIPFQTIQQNYSGIILSYGADSENSLNIPNENAWGSFSARNFISWYNGHILQFKDSVFNKVDFSKINDVVIIGNGNVAVDVARMLSKRIDELRGYDIPGSVLERLSESKVRNIHMVARRGVIQAAFTVKEMRELSKVHGVRMFVYRDELEQSLTQDFGNKLLPAERRQITRKVDLVKSFNIIEKGEETQINSSDKNIILRFWMSPSEILVNTSEQVIGVKFNKKDTNTDTQSQSIINTNFVLKSIGYKSRKLFDNILFDPKSNNIVNNNGVIFDSNNNILQNAFCVGWVKTGAKGVIDYTLRDSYQTTESIFQAISSNQIKETTPDYASIVSNIKKKTVTFDDWKRIDAFEIAQGKKMNKVREKLVDLDKMLSLI